ncbi:GNAT family N-acetyltransferase [Deinococcus koreensis]|uniref:GNAT family N-acetyltransferase n=1 Tax=Deinococcus koreensis TaxID=2054903 RepID=A0A2K3UZN5_9DEIO|nr:GNAT family N-acetyltransferase [Deinococcus koreensis]PNY81991.1 GNAT family N-acetyltransferase [Deinococcus koreensis]
MTTPSSTLLSTLREPRLPDDYGEMAAVLNASRPDWPTTPEDLAREDQIHDPAMFRTRLVAEQGGRVVAVAGFGHDSHSYEDWRYWGGINVHPDARGQGIGTALYSELLRQAAERGARELRTGSSDQPHDAVGRAFLERRGWSVAWERYESQLSTADLDLGTFDELFRQVEESGVRLISLTELEGDPERDRQLWELDSLLFEDVPLGTPFTKKALEQWVKEEMDDPHLAKELSFVAVRPGLRDPLLGDYIGYSTLGRAPDGTYYIGMTGVRREDRGRGIAKALKVAAMRALHAAGGGVIKTFNDPPNVAMLGMNAALGFRRTATRYRYELRLDGLKLGGLA